eukprot:3547284-Rhodomonas_salina.1
MVIRVGSTENVYGPTRLHASLALGPPSRPCLPVSARRIQMHFHTASVLFVPADSNAFTRSLRTVSTAKVSSRV